MSQIDFAAETTKFASTVSARLDAAGPEICSGVYQASLPLLYWLDYLRNSERTGCCDDFLDGVRASVVETSGCLASGLVRSAISALRTQIDILLSWLFFKDHPIEWQRVHDYGEGFI